MAIRINVANASSVFAIFFNKTLALSVSFINSDMAVPSAVLINATAQSSKKPLRAYSAAVKAGGRIPEKALIYVSHCVKKNSP